EILTSIQGELPYANLALQPFAHDRERVSRHAAIWREVIRAIDVHRIDFGLVRELYEIDHARRLRADLVEVILRQDHVAALLELVAPHDFRVRDFAVAVRTPPLLLDARLTLAVQLVERDGRPGFRRRKHSDRDVHEA